MIPQNFDKFRKSGHRRSDGSLTEDYYRFYNGRQIQKTFQDAYPQIAGAFKIIYKGSSRIVYIYRARNDKIEELKIRNGLSIEHNTMIKIINFIL